MTEEEAEALDVLMMRLAKAVMIRGVILKQPFVPVDKVIEIWIWIWREIII